MVVHSADSSSSGEKNLNPALTLFFWPLFMLDIELLAVYVRFEVGTGPCFAVFFVVHVAFLRSTRCCFERDIWPTDDDDDEDDSSDSDSGDGACSAAGKAVKTGKYRASSCVFNILLVF